MRHDVRLVMTCGSCLPCEASYRQDVAVSVISSELQLMYADQKYAVRTCAITQFLV
jgi:hypothetical protein